MKRLLAFYLLLSPALAQNTPRLEAGGFRKDTVSEPLAKEKPKLNDSKDDVAFAAYQRGYYLTAFNEALKRVEKDKDPVAMTLIAEIYAQGLGVPQSQEKALVFYKAAAQKGDKNALFAHGMIELKNKKIAEGIALLKQAAEQNHLGALYNLGLYYFNSDPATQDLVKAATYFEKAANAGEPNAQYAFAQMLFEGQGRDPNALLGNVFLSRAADYGLTEAQIDYGIALLSGKGMKVNEKLGVQYLRKAALKGNPIAQNRYARLLVTGKGVAPNLKEAARWHTVASLQGVNDSYLDTIVSKLDEKERREAISIGTKWLAPSQ